jgi:hypothetical protein
VFEAQEFLTRLLHGGAFQLKFTQRLGWPIGLHAYVHANRRCASV